MSFLKSNLFFFLCLQIGSSKLTDTDAALARPTISDNFTTFKIYNWFKWINRKKCIIIGKNIKITILAASSKLSHAMMRSLLVAIKAFASSTLVPCKRTTIGTFNFKLLAASIIPWAITSHLKFKKLFLHLIVYIIKLQVQKIKKYTS